MTTNAMSCELFNDRLMDYLEHETDDVTRLAIERHAVTCADCGALLADLRKLRVDAANLPELMPSHDLWSGIAARIEAPVVSINAGRTTDARRTTYGVGSWTRRALIAASLVGAAGIGYTVASRRGATMVVSPMSPVAVQQRAETVYTTPPNLASTGQVPETVIVREPAPAAQTPVTPVARNDAASVVAVMSRDYDREITRLHALIEQRRNQMDPTTVAIVEKNLQVIDTAIAECRKAIERDPSSRFLIESLNQSLQTKVELMRTAALLPTRT
jgi:hypothetical protein